MKRRHPEIYKLKNPSNGYSAGTEVQVVATYTEVNNVLDTYHDCKVMPVNPSEYGKTWFYTRLDNLER